MVEGIKPTDSIFVELNMNQFEFNEAKKEALRAKVAKKYSVPLKNVNVKFVPITMNENGERISLASDIINNVHRPEFQVDLEEKWIKASDYKDVDMEKIISIDKEVNAFVDFDAYSKYKQYRFKYVKWDNFLSYGSGNFFDFTKLHGLVLLNGDPENQCGKTTFAIDLLRFALFGKSNKVPVLERAFNAFLPKETKVMVEACIEIDGIDYVIRRTLERPALSKRTAKSKIKQNVEYFKLLNGEYEEIENCEGESNTATSGIIKEAVGSVEDFDLVISATSKTLTDLLEMGQTDKGKLFSKWLGLITIEEKYEQANKIWKTRSKSLFSNVYNKEAVSSEIKNIELCVDEDKKKIEAENSLIEEETKKISELEKKRDEAYRKRRPIDSGIEGLDVVTIENKIQMVNDEILQKNGLIASVDAEIAKMSGVVFSSDEYANAKELLEEERKKIFSFESKNGELRGKIISLREDNKRIQKLMEGNICPTCGHKIDIMEQSIFIDRNKEEEKKLTEEGISNKAQIEICNNNISALSSTILKMENDRDIVNERQRKVLYREAVVNSVNSLSLSLDSLYKQKNDIEKNRENILFNNNVENEINILNASITSENSVLVNMNKIVNELLGEIKYYSSEIEKRKEIIKKLDEEEVLIKHWNIYLEMMGKNGITKMVLRNALPILNNEISRLLDGVCDFQVKIEMDEKNNVGINLYKDNVIMDLGVCGSGFEGTVASLALRSALGNISTMSKPNFLCTDEVLGLVGNSNYDKLQELYNRIATNYDFIINITHNELIYDWHNQNITVKKTGNISTILFNGQ